MKRLITAAALLLTVCLLAGCTAPGTGGGRSTGPTERKTSAPETQPPIPSGYARYTIENFGLSVPDSFNPFTSGDKSNLLALNDRAAQIYVRKCTAADTGTDESYFNRLSAAEYCDLYCAVKGITDCETITSHAKRSAAVRYTVPGDSDDTTAVFSLYFIRDTDHGCVWLVRTRHTLNTQETYDGLFEELTYWMSAAE
ncbi:MAG: hypothetical protein MJ192_00995 [Clostridia bacterium]|nr:hypothetical protein [Clostridia bacterium]